MARGVKFSQFIVPWLESQPPAGVSSDEVAAHFQVRKDVASKNLRKMWEDEQIGRVGFGQVLIYCLLRNQDLAQAAYNKRAREQVEERYALGADLPVHSTIRGFTQQHIEVIPAGQWRLDHKLGPCSVFDLQFHLQPIGA